MSNRIFIAGLFSIIALSGCERQEVKIKDQGPPNSTDYFEFGHLQSFCMNCDAVYKIQNGKLYGANHQLIGDPDSVQFKLLPGSSYNLVSSLPSKIPPQLLNETSTTIGSYWPDAGHFYIKISQNNVEHHWFIEAGERPEYLSGFLNDLSEAMTKLN